MEEKLFFLLFFGVVFIFFLFWQKRNKSIENNLAERFKSLSFDLMEKNTKQFLDLATMVLDKYEQGAKTEIDKRHKEIETVITPVNETLKKVEELTRQMEKSREGAYANLHQQITSLIETEHRLRKETSNLTRALKSPNVRGGWGQIHLRRVVELSGMVKNCDFFEQQSITKEDKTYRPDLVIRLPAGRQIIVDAKAPIDAYLEAVDIEDEDKKAEKLKEHAKQVKKHINDLSQKEYWKHFDLSPEYVILFLPVEALFSSALQIEPALVEMGAKKNIIIATPTTLIAILRAVALGWKQEKISDNSKQIEKMGKQLYERLITMNSHWQKLGKSLSSSIDSYNQAISSLESRVLVSARKFQEMSVGTDELLSLDEINKTTRSLFCEKKAAALEEGSSKIIE
jgi:DNA recombination protein RmuC